MTDVLIVDDERAVLDVLTDVLTDEGYSIVTAPDGQAALELLDRGIRPLLVVTDLMMPRLSGRRARGDAARTIWRPGASGGRDER